MGGHADGHRVEVIPVDVVIGAPPPGGDVGRAEGARAAVVEHRPGARQDPDGVVQALDEDLVAVAGAAVSSPSTTPARSASRGVAVGRLVALLPLIPGTTYSPHREAVNPPGAGDAQADAVTGLTRSDPRHAETTPWLSAVGS